jgi:ankyrin repeat protein
MKKIILFLLFFLSTISTFAHKDRWDYNKTGWSPLMLAIYNEQTVIFTKLIEQNANVNYISPGLNGSWRLTALEVAIRKGNVLAVKKLLLTNKISKPSKYLMTACSENSAIVVELLIKYGANPDEKLKNGYSVSMMAASFGSFEVLECLLKHGADLKQTRRVDGMTTLMFAVLNGNPKKIKLLLEYGANKYARDKNGQTALNYVEQNYEQRLNEKTKLELRKMLK